MGIEFDPLGVILIYLGIGALIVAWLISMFEKADEETRAMLPEGLAKPVFVLYGVVWPIVVVIFIRLIWAAFRSAMNKGPK